MKKRETFKLRSPEKRARVGERIKLAATSSGLSLKDLAGHAGTSPALIYQYVRGITNIPMDVLHAIADVTKVGMEFFDPEKETMPGGGVSAPAAREPAPAKQDRVASDMRFLYQVADAQENGRNSRALFDTLNQLLALARTSDDRKQEAYILWRMGAARKDGGHYEEARSDLTRAIRMFGDLGLEEYRQMATLDLGTTYQEIGAMDAAFEETNSIAQSGGPEARWLANLNLGAFHYRKQEFSQAMKQFCEAARTLEQLANPDKIAAGIPLLLTHVGDIAKDTGHYESALKLLGRAVSQATDKKQPNVYLESLLTMARCSQALGRLSDAKQQLEQAVVLAGFLFEDENRLGVAKAMLAEILATLGELEAAKEQARAAVRIANRVGGPRGIALASLALAEIAIASGQFYDARDYAADAITEAHRAQRPHEHAMARSARARACLGLAAEGVDGMLLDAESEARRAVQIADDSGAVRERALTRLTLSRVLVASGRREQAEAILHEIVVLLQSGAATLQDLLGDGQELPLLLRSSSFDLDREFSDRRVTAPAVEWEAGILGAKLRPADTTIEPLRTAAAALTRLLAGLSAEDAVRYGKVHPDADLLYREFSRLAVTAEDKRQLRLLANRASPQSDQVNGIHAVITGKS